MKKSIISAVFIIITLFIISACSSADSDTAIVNIDLGLKKNASRVPALSDVNSISLTVTGEGMAAISRPVDLTTGIIQMEVPAGPAREFSVVADTPASAPASFRGRETADLSTGETVDLNIKMAALYRSEGSIAAPIFIQTNTGEQAGRVSKDRSYYYTQNTADFLDIFITNLTDDADLICYSDPDFTTEVGISKNGRTMEENYSTSSSDLVYFVIDGKYTGVNSEGEGAAYTIKSVSTSMGSMTYISEGSTSEPKGISANESTGFTTYGMVGSNGTSYYVTAITPGITYCLNASGSVTTTAYRDQFVTSTAIPFSLNTGHVYFSIAGNYTSYVIELVTNEGTASSPIYLFPEKTNYCQVGSSSSYYIFEVTAGTQYTATAYFDYNEVEFSAYNDGTFTNLAGNSTTVENISELTFTPASPVITIRVDDVSGNGSAFRLEVAKNL